MAAPATSSLGKPSRPKIKMGSITMLMAAPTIWEIMESFGNDVQATLDAAESGETPNSQYMEVTWQSYWNDSLLSLSIRVLGWTSDLIDYAVYHYDFETGQRPDNLELLDRFHVDEGDFIAALRRGAARQFDSHYAPWGTGGLSPEDENYGGISIT